MSRLGEEVVSAARAWIGTPYRHQASCRGGGADCLGLVRGVWREVRGAEPERVPAYSFDWAEAGRQEWLWRAALRHFMRVPREEEAPGHLLLFRMRDGAVAKHLGIQAGCGEGANFIHAYSGHGVVESPLSAPWRRRIVARFAFPQGV
ncbi:MAG: NlpC/P60 family protein [Phycisphaerales bacterium]